MTKTLIPESQRPTDLDYSMIRNPVDAEFVLVWLNSIIDDMESQISDDQSFNWKDDDWKYKVRSALRHAKRAKFRVETMLKGMKDNDITLSDAFMEVASDIFEEDDLKEIYEEIGKRWPTLFPMSALPVQDLKPGE